MPARMEDGNGHNCPGIAPALAAGAVGTSALGTIAGTTKAGAAPTVTAVSGTDNEGCFTLNPVTGGGAQAAGETCGVYFSAPYGRAPRAVSVVVNNITTPDAPALVAAYASTITAGGWFLHTAALTTANNYLVQYRVFY